MNFKKPLSLLLIAGISIGITASDNNNNIKKDELKAKIQQNISNKDAYILRSFGFGSFTLYAIANLRAGLREYTSTLEFLNEYNESQGIIFCTLRSLIGNLHTGVINYTSAWEFFNKHSVSLGITFCSLISLLGTAATGYYGFKSYQEWKNANSAKQELATLE